MKRLAAGVLSGIKNSSGDGLATDDESAEKIGKICQKK